MQMYGMPYSTSFHQLHGTIPWQTAQPGFGTIGGQQQTMYNPCVGTPLAASTAYNNQLSYPTQPREAQFRGTPPNRMLLPLQTHPQGATTTSHPGYMPGIECYTSQPLHGPAHESMQTRPRTRSASGNYRGPGCSGPSNGTKQFWSAQRIACIAGYQWGSGRFLHREGTRNCKAGSIDIGASR